MAGTDVPQSKDPRLFIFFYLPLLWPMGIPDRGRFTMIRNEQVNWLPEVSWPSEYATWPERRGATNFVEITVHRRAQEQVFDDAVFQHAKDVAYQTSGHDFFRPRRATSRIPLPTSNAAATILELMTPLIADPSSELDPISAAFNRCIEEVNILELAYLMTCNDLRLRPTTRATSFLAVPYATVNPVTNVMPDAGIFMVNPGMHLLPYDVEDLDMARLNEASVRILMLKKRNPLLVFVERSQAAARTLHIDGDFSAAVIFCHTAGEVLFDSLLLMMAWEELHFWDSPALIRDDVVGWFTKRSSVETRLHQHYHVRLEGGWDPARRDTPLYRWIKNVGRLRNRAVHAGHRPTEREAVQALETLQEVETYIKDRLVDDRNRGRYPRVALMLLGRSGLEQRGVYSGKVRRIDEASQDDDWVGSFVEFRSWLDGELERDDRVEQ